MLVDGSDQLFTLFMLNQSNCCYNNYISPSYCMCKLRHSKQDYYAIFITETKTVSPAIQADMGQ